MPSRHPHRLIPVNLAQVKVNDAFWSPRIKANLRATLPHAYRFCKETGRIDAMRLNWRKGKPGRPHPFWDSDVAKWIEAAACSLAANPDKNLEKKIDGYVRLMEKAQMPDGYLNSYFQTIEPEKRWTDLHSKHELYCAGHLIEAAVAYFGATGKERMLRVMRRYADHIARIFGKKRGQKRGYPGHQEIELALVKLYRVTGEARYLELAAFFLDERGQDPSYFTSEALRRGMGRADAGQLGNNTQLQDHLPVRRQTTAEGHAVRALYMYCGMADVAGVTNDRELAAACRRLWENIVTRRMYVTGGIGSSRSGERFTHDHDLPNDVAYAETCAAIAMVFFAHRMLHLDLNAEYADIMERALYNGVLSGVSLDGKRFFYANPLEVIPADYIDRPDYTRGDSIAAGRRPWFSCACCPTNIARLLASFGQYVYSFSANEVAVHLYVQGKARFSLSKGDMTINQKTGYPWKEKAVMEILLPGQGSELEFTLSLRLPGWCRKPAIKLNGRGLRLSKITVNGYTRITRSWKHGDRIELTLPMPVETMEADPRVRHNCGRIALQRGPIVYCLEEIDNGPDLADMILAANREHGAGLRAIHKPNLMGGCTVITGCALRRDRARWKDALYLPGSSPRKPARFTAVPYCLWNNRGDGEMRVWL